jgi:hypothetical protein
MTRAYLSICISVIGAAHLFAAQQSPAAENRQPLPSLRTLVGYLGVSTSSSDFIALKKACALRLHSRTEHVDLLPPPTPRARSFRPPLTVTTAYGGSGLLVYASATVHIEGDLSSAPELPVPQVTGIWLIVGDCAEREMFGTWKGERPDIDLLITPESLIRQQGIPDADSVDVHFENGGRIEKTRKRWLNYGTPWSSYNHFPYAFYFENDRLAIIALLRPDRPGRIVPPTLPSAK